MYMVKLFQVYSTASNIGNSFPYKNSDRQNKIKKTNLFFHNIDRLDILLRCASSIFLLIFIV